MKSIFSHRNINSGVASHVSKSKYFLVLFFLCFHLAFAQSSNEEVSNVEFIKHHLTRITKTEQSRSYQNVKTLDTVASYIFQEFKKYCDTIYYQPYKVNGVSYKNVIGVISPKKEERIIIGAHYDVAGDQEGADDNATGVVGLLELA